MKIASTRLSDADLKMLSDIQEHGESFHDMNFTKPGGKLNSTLILRYAIGIAHRAVKETEREHSSTAKLSHTRSTRKSKPGKRVRQQQ